MAPLIVEQIKTMPLHLVQNGFLLKTSAYRDSLRYPTGGLASGLGISAARALWEFITVSGQLLRRPREAWGRGGRNAGSCPLSLNLARIVRWNVLIYSGGPAPSDIHLGPQCRIVHKAAWFPRRFHRSLSSSQRTKEG